MSLKSSIVANNMKKKLNFTISEGATSFNQLVETVRDNEFVEVLRRVTSLMQIKEDTSYTQILSKNIQSMAAEFEMKLDEYLDNKSIPFRTNVFLLILLQELCEKFLSQ